MSDFRAAFNDKQTTSANAWWNGQYCKVTMAITMNEYQHDHGKGQDVTELAGARP